MALRGGFGRVVAFLIGTRTPDVGEARATPIGTGFFLGVRTPADPPSKRAFTLYMVTAAHVVRAERETAARLRRLDGSLHDHVIPAQSWNYHDSADVAVVPLELDETEQPFDIAVMPVPDFFPAGAGGRHPGRRVSNRPMLGDNVYFIGLFALIPAMGERNLPLVRSGTLAALAQEDVPLRLPDDTVLRQTAHLIDCRSYRGFSGSPCLIQFPRDPSLGGVGRPHEETELLGLISGHFDDQVTADLTGEIASMGTVGVAVSVGVGVVTPVDAIEELLYREDVKEDRSERERSYLREATAPRDPESLPANAS